MEVAFHTGLDDRVSYACRLLRKAVARGARVVVDGPPHELDLLDQALWTFEPQEFLPHIRWRPGASAAVAARTPIWLVDEEVASGLPPARPSVLVHLGDRTVEEAEAWERVIELVSDDEALRRAARARWRAYEARGWRVTHHPMNPARGS